MVQKRLVLIEFCCGVRVVLENSVLKLYRIAGPLILLGLLLAVSNSQRVLAEDDSLADGQQEYAQSNYGKAVSIFNAIILKNPKDSAAHYMLGNTYQQLERSNDAIHEYEFASRLDPTGKVGNYSRAALSGIRAKLNPPPMSAISPASPIKRTESDNGASKAAEKLMELQKDRDSKIKFIRDQSNEKIQQLQNEMNEEIAANGRARSGRGRMYYDPSDLNSEIKKNYEPRMNRIEEDSTKRIEEINKAYQEHESALK